MANPNAPEMEPAEGSRETVNENLERDDPARERYIDENAKRGSGKASGITNRPLSREIEEQSQLPPRGEAKQTEE